MKTAEEVLGDIVSTDTRTVIVEKCCFYRPQTIGGRHYDAGVDYDIEVPYIEGDNASLERAKRMILALRKACERPTKANAPNEAADDFNTWTVDDLANECEELKIDVVRADGSGRNPLKADYVAALEAYYNGEEGEETDDTNTDDTNNTTGGI